MKSKTRLIEPYNLRGEQMKKQSVTEEDWDYLIVLDACRYDFFEEIYEEYLDGELEKRKTKGSSTLEWLAKTFQGKYDVNYYSANPYINGKGISLDDSEWGSSCDYEWNPVNHFSNIIDVWDFGWDDDLGTVPPKNVNRAYLSNKDDGRSIIHYMQPHAPYISGGEGRKLKQIRKGFSNKTETDNETKLDSIKQWIQPKIEELLIGRESIMKLGMLLDLDPKVFLKEIRKDGSEETLKSYYEDNLRIVLESASDLVEELDGKIVVTADHGEAFGEEGVWEHHNETYIPALIEIPWLEIEK